MGQQYLGGYTEGAGRCTSLDETNPLAMKEDTRVRIFGLPPDYPINHPIFEHTSDSFNGDKRAWACKA